MSSPATTAASRKRAKNPSARAKNPSARATNPLAFVRDLVTFVRTSLARWGLRAIGVAIAGAFALSLVVYPVRDYFDQRGRIAAKQREFEALADANEQLFNEVERLETPEGIRGAARSQLGYVLPGEERVALTPMPALPTTLPEGWPYSMVTDILRVRTTQAQNTTGALAPLAP